MAQAHTHSVIHTDGPSTHGSCLSAYGSYLSAYGSCLSAYLSACEGLRRSAKVCEFTFYTYVLHIHTEFALSGHQAGITQNSPCDFLGRVGE